MYKKGLNLSEVLLVLVIIGVAAVLVLPQVINNTKDREYATARKRVMSTVGEAVRLIAVQGNIRDAENARDFVENYLKKQLQIQKTCDNDKLRECGLETKENKIFDVNEKPISMPKTLRELGVNNGYGINDASLSGYGFVLSNGYSINLFYNPGCTSKNLSGWRTSQVCVNILYDMNGLSGPNQIGKDIGIVTVFYPNIQTKSISLGQIKFVSTYLDAVGNSCEDFSPADIDELTAVCYNRNLFGFQDYAAPTYTSTTSYDNENLFSLYVAGGCGIKQTSKNNKSSFLCIKR